MKDKRGKKIRIENFFSPRQFSLINNGDEMLEFFSSIIELIRQITQTKNKRKIFIDISKVEDLTIDAVIYLIVIIRNLTAKRDKIGRAHV